jgi:AcrR family transcriptional regulator
MARLPRTLPFVPYHHGDLRAALLAGAIEEIEAVGPAAMSMRAVARRAGVSHTAATYHFGDKTGLLTAVAADGYRMLGGEMTDAVASGGTFLDIGIAYVRFALARRAHFDVMFRPELYDADDEELTAARAVTARLLYGEGDVDAARTADGVAAWSLVHGFAMLWINGNVPDQLGNDPEAVAREVLTRLTTRRR